MYILLLLGRKRRKENSDSDVSFLTMLGA